MEAELKSRQVRKLAAKEIKNGKINCLKIK